jgi:EmrB/QacA subfamily drug resistance transporter
MWVLVAAVLGSSMTFIDGSATNVILPIIQAQLHASAEDAQWVVEGFALVLSALILTGGSLGDVFGRRLVFVLGVVLFGLASIGCGIAASPAILIGSRCVQGAGAALMTPGSLALISASFTGAERGRAIGTWAGFASLTSAAGPVLGGYLAQTFSWRAVFFINIPLAIGTILIALLAVPESRDDAAPRTVDVPGIALATFGLFALTFGLIREERPLIDPAGFGAIVAGVAGLVAFVWWERRAKTPMMPPFLFADRSFAVLNAYTLLLYAPLGASLYFLPYVLIDVQHFSPVEAGAALLPLVAVQFALSRWSGGNVARLGVRLPLVIGACFGGVAFLLFALPGAGAGYLPGYLLAVLALAAGVTWFVAPLTTGVLDAAPRSHSGIASGVNNAVSRVAGLLAIAVFGIVLANAFSGGIPGPAALGRSIALREAFLTGYRHVVYLSAAISFAAAALAWFGIPKRIATVPPSGHPSAVRSSA